MLLNSVLGSRVDSHLFPEVITSATSMREIFVSIDYTKETVMPRDQGTSDRLSKLLQQLISLTQKASCTGSAGSVQRTAMRAGKTICSSWGRRRRSSETKTPRYLS